MLTLIKSWLIKIFLGLIALSFAVWGIGDIFRSPQDPTVASVGDVDIHASQLQREYNRQLEQLRAATGGQIDAEQARAFGIVDRALQSLMTQSVVDQQAAALGIRVSDEMILDEIRSHPQFMNDQGRFDPARFSFVLSNNLRLTEEGYIARMRGDIGRAQMLDSIFSGIDVPSRLVSTIKTHRAEQRVVEATIVDAAAITDVPVPDEAQIDTFYAENQSRFMASEYRKITYVLLRPIDLLDEIEIDEELLREEYEIRLDQLTEPERRDIDMFVVPDADVAAAAHQRIVDGEDFVAVGAEVSDFSADDIRLGQVTERDLLAEQADLIFGLSAVGLAEPIQTEFEYLLVRVNDIQPSRVPSFEDAGPGIRQDLKIAEAIDAIFELSKTFEDELAGGATLEQAAAAVGADVQVIDAVDRFGFGPDREPYDPLPPIQNFLNLAFQAEPGIETQLTEAPGNMLYSLRVDETIPPELRPLAAVRDDVIKAWQDEHTRDFAQVIAEKVATAVKDGTPLSEAASAEGFEAATSAPFKRDGTDLDLALTGGVVRAAFEMKIGEVSDALPNGTGKYAVIRLVDISMGEVDSEGPLGGDELTRELRESFQADVAAAFEGALLRNYSQSVNRAVVDNMF